VGGDGLFNSVVLWELHSTSFNEASSWCAWAARVSTRTSGNWTFVQHSWLCRYQKGSFLSAVLNSFICSSVRRVLQQQSLLLLRRGVTWLKYVSWFVWEPISSLWPARWQVIVTSLITFMIFLFSTCMCVRACVCVCACMCVSADCIHQFKSCMYEIAYRLWSLKTVAGSDANHHVPSL